MGRRLPELSRDPPPRPDGERAQVRQPVHSRSVGRWTGYQHQHGLAELFEKIRPGADSRPGAG